jgi:hypothetical protein
MTLTDDPPDPGLPYYKTIKTSLTSVLKIPAKQVVISKAVSTVNKIVIKSLLFLRLYLIHQKTSAPLINAEFIDTVFKTVCQQKNVGRPPSPDARALRDKLTAFYEQHFVPLLPERDQPVSYTHLNTVLDYAAVQLLTAFLPSPIALFAFSEQAIRGVGRHSHMNVGAFSAPFIWSGSRDQYQATFR